MANIRIDFSAPERAAFWKVAALTGIATIETHPDGAEYLATSRHIQIHDDNGSGQRITLKKAVFDDKDNLISPAEYAPDYHVSIVVNAVIANDIQQKLAIWQTLGETTKEQGQASGLQLQSVTLLENIRSPQHRVAV